MNLDDVIRELRVLNKSVPKPRRLPTPKEIKNAERKLGVSFHPDYYKYLLLASDVVYGILEPSTVIPENGHTYLADVAYAAWEQMDVPRELIPICEDNGDYYCMNAEGEVVFWSHNGVTNEKWPNLATWIQQVWIEER